MFFRSAAVWDSPLSLVNVTCLGLLAMLAGKSWNVWNGGRWCSYLAARSKKETRRVGTACLSRSLLLLPLSASIFPSVFLSLCLFWAAFLAPVGRRWLKVNEIKKKVKHLRFITYMKRNIVWVRMGGGWKCVFLFSFQLRACCVLLNWG